jgi:hypothetical protein
LVVEGASDYRTVNKPLAKSRRKEKLDREVVRQFFIRDDNSCMTSGKRQVKSLKGNEQQIHFLNYSIDNLYHKFCSENGELIGKTTFRNWKPFFVIKPRVSDRKQCLCQICENLQVNIAR